MEPAHLPDSYYESSLTAKQSRVNYPTLNVDLNFDVCIVGGGYTGLHTALNLQEKGLKVVVLEANRVGHAASGRNGGHVIQEFGASQRSFETHLDMESARKVWRISHQAADDLRARVAQYNIACDYQAGHIEAAITSKHVDGLKDWQAHISRNYGYQTQWIPQAEMSQYIGSTRYKAGLLDSHGGHLHPLKLALGLAQALINGGGEIYEKSAVINWQVEGEKVTVITAEAQVKCAHLILACNVGMDSIENAVAQKIAQRILPVATWVIATEQLPAILAAELLPTRAAVVDTRFILDYYRLSADDRVIFGGGCSYTGQETPAGFIETMRSKMIKVFPQLVNTKVEFGWGGLIDISMNRMPDFGYAETSKRVFYAQGFSGSGIVSTQAAANVICDAVMGNAKDLAMFQRIQHAAFPGGKWLRGPITAAGMLYHRFLDLC